MGTRRILAAACVSGGLLVATLAVGLPRARSESGPVPPDGGGPIAPAVVNDNDADAAPTDDDGEDDLGGDGGLVLPVAPADPAARDAWLAEQLDAAVRDHPLLITAQVGAAVVDVASGKVLWIHHADRPLNLASVNKVITAAAALHGLGAGFRWRTSVLAEKLDPDSGSVQGDLFIRGRGDPTLTVAGLNELAQSLAWRGVTEVTGDLVFDGSYFDLVDEPPRYADQPKERAGYRAPVGAASLERNAVTVVVVADRFGQGLAEVSIDPPLGDYVRLIDASVVTVASGRTRIHVATQVKRDHIELRVSGQILIDEGVYFQRRRVDDPVHMFGEAFRAALATHGIRVRGRKIGHGLAPATAILLAERESATLADVMRPMVKNSDNYLAETVLKTLGAEARILPAPPAVPPPATWADGTTAVMRYLTEQAGIDASTVRYENGSGLYDSTAIPASAVVQVLVAAWRDFRVGPDLAAALATGGVDGTMRRRFRDERLRGRIRAKTGTLAQVSSLAGYAGTDSGHPLAFVVIVNAMAPEARGEARALQDQVAALCVAYTAP